MINKHISTNHSEYYWNFGRLTAINTPFPIMAPWLVDLGEGLHAWPSRIGFIIAQATGAKPVPSSLPGMCRRCPDQQPLWVEGLAKYVVLFPNPPVRGVRGVTSRYQVTHQSEESLLLCQGGAWGQTCHSSGGPLTWKPEVWGISFSPPYPPWPQ